MKNKIIVSLFVIFTIIAASENITNPQDSNIWINIFGLIGCILLFYPMLSVIAEINESI